MGNFITNPGSINPGSTTADRRGFVQAAGTPMLAGLLGGFGISPALAQSVARETGRSEKPLKAAFSNAGLQATWCAQGKQAAEWWGRLFNVEVTWFDGELNATKQRSPVENIASPD